MLCLGIESSCDETSLALVEDGRPAGMVLASQADLHALFGGVVPELASREHCRHCGALCDELMRRAGRSLDEVDAVAVARGPGLLGSLLVGVAFAKGLVLGTGARLVGVNHLHAHLLAAGLEREMAFPALGLLVSGGHTNLCRMEGPTRIIQLGRTLDDAAGEAFDKVGSAMGLAYPGGALMDALARRGRADAGLFPRPYCDNDNLDFSFSGLKTAACTWLRQALPDASWPHPLRRAEDAPQALADGCASFNLAVVDTLLLKTARALDAMPDLRRLVVAGGVAANSLLRERAAALMRDRGGEAIFPSPLICSDNAAMIAHAGFLLAREGWEHDLSMETIPRGMPIPDDMRRAGPHGEA